MKEIKFNLDDFSIEGLENLTHYEIDELIALIKSSKENKLSDSDEKTYIFRATFIRLLADFLLENKVRLKEDFYSVTSGTILYLSNLVDKIPDDYKRYKWLLDFDNFSILYGSLMNEIMLHTTSTELKEQDEKSRETLLELKRKL